MRRLKPRTVAALAALVALAALCCCGRAYAYAPGGDDGWFWQNPVWPAPSDISFADATNGWAVGRHGAILHTVDSGVIWDTQRSHVITDLRAVDFASALTGWAVGDKGMVLHSTDAGVTWSVQAPAGAGDLTAVYARSSFEAWVAGAGGYIAHTTDGGAGWTQQPSQTTATVNAFSTSPDGSLWAAGDDGLILHNTNGSDTWSAQTAPVQEDLAGIAFGTGDRGCVTGAAGAICWTDDGGKTWRVVRAKGAAWPDTLYSAAFVDPLHGIATGLAGDLFRTADGGATWTKVTTTADMPVLDIAMADSLHGWAVDQARALLRTNDGGLTWTPQTVPDGVSGLRAIDCTSADTAWAVGLDGAVIHTADGGATWTYQPKLTKLDLLDVVFPDAAHGWIAADGAILATSDGGDHWQFQYTDDKVTFDSLDFVNRTDGWAVGWSHWDRPCTLHTTNGGQTWTPAGANLPRLAAIKFADPQHGWAVCNEFTVDSMPASGVYATTDGGASWKLGGMVPGRLQGLTNLGADLVWAVGESGTLEYSPDGGAHWMIRTGNVAALGGVGFSDAATAVTAGAAGVVLRSSQDGTFWTSVGPERTTQFTTVDVLGQNGWITDRDGRLYLTTDGGQSWTLIPRTDPLDLGSLQAVACTDDQNAWAIGAGVIPSIVHTADGGLTWTRQFSGHPYNGTLQDAPLGLAFPTSTSGWVVGDQGLILHTSDAGATWTRQSFGSNRLIGVAFADDRNGWAVGWDSTILHTVDGGATWTRQTVPAGIGDSERFLGVSCTDASTAWVVGYYGEILHTSDGGTNWRLEDSGVSWDLKGVTFTDPLTGWAVADWSLLHTVDGGVTWTPVTVDPLVWLTGVSFADARTGWAVGAQGAMLRTTDGGKTWTHEESGLTSDQAVACVAAADTYTAWAVAGSVVLHRGDSGRPHDVTAPTTAAAGSASGWSKTAASIDLTSSDASGVAFTEWRVGDDPHWSIGTHVVIDEQGTNTLQYRSIDNQGNLEAAREMTVRVDGVAPTTRALTNVSVRKGKTALLRFLLIDPPAPSCTLRLEVRRSGRVVRTSALRSAKPGSLTVRWRCPLRAGRYTYRLLATDLAGNPQSSAVARKLTVR